MASNSETGAPITQVRVPGDWIDLGIGQPQTDNLPLEEVAAAARHRFQRQDRRILAYGFEKGSGPFRTALAGFLGARYGRAVDPDHLFITGGASQALDMICALKTTPGDTVIVEEPSYFLALRIFADYQLKVIGTPIDENGILVDDLEKRLKRHRPALVYSIPVFHNPAGVTLASKRREKLVELSQQYGFLLVADEVYQLLHYTSVPPPPMAYYGDARRVLSLGSFSKILAPGLKLGWIQARPSLLRPFAACGYLDSGGGLNPFVAGIVGSVIELGLQASYLKRLQGIYQSRMNTLRSALHRHIPALKFREPAGGYFIWARLPAGVDCSSLLTAARTHKVRFQPGSNFSYRQGLQEYIRLCFAYHTQKDLRAGVERLAQAIEKGSS